MILDLKEKFKINTDYGTTVTKWVSGSTGLTLYFIPHKGPTIEGNIVVGSKVHDDRGAAHSLEHLFYYGSEKHPYKDYLELLTYTCLGDKPGATTADDRFIFNFKSASQDGFFMTLEEHIETLLYPALPKEAYDAEIYHVDGHGHDAGVVYCEQLHKEKYYYIQLIRALRRLLYNEASGYKYEEGGLPDKLRELTYDQVVDYHKAYFRPDNLCLIIFGDVDYCRLIQEIEAIDNMILGRGLPTTPLPTIRDTPVDYPHIDKDITQTVTYPSEDESVGHVMLAWVGPPLKDTLTQNALEILTSFLCDSGISVLQRSLTNENKCGDIEMNTIYHTITVINLHVMTVPIEHMENISNEIMSIIQNIVENEAPDLPQIHAIIEQSIHGDNTTSDFIREGFMSIAGDDFLYGDPEGDFFDESVNNRKILKQLLNFTVQDWISILKRWLLDQPRITLLAMPSRKMAETQQEEYGQLVETRMKQLGPAKLFESEERVTHALEVCQRPIPPDLLASIPLPSIDSVRFHPTITAFSCDDVFGIQLADNPVQNHISSEHVHDLPPFIQYHHIESENVYISAHVSKDAVEQRLMPYTYLFLEILFTCPRKIGDTIVSYEQVIQNSQTYLVSNSALAGDNCGYTDMASFYIEAEKSNYAKAITHLQQAFWHSHFTVENLKMEVKTRINYLSDITEDPYEVTKYSYMTFIYDELESTRGPINTLYQTIFLRKLLERLEHEPDEVLRDMNAYRDQLFRRDNIRIHVVGNILDLMQPRGAFSNFIPKEVSTKVSESSLLVPAVSSVSVSYLGNMARAIEISTNDISECTMLANSINAYDHPDRAALKVTIRMLMAMNGPLYNRTRGKGLAYNIHLYTNIREGYVAFDILHTVNPFEAFSEAKSVIEYLSSAEDNVDDVSIRAAISSSLCSIISDEETVVSSAQEAFCRQTLCGLAETFHRQYMESIQKVTREDIHRILNKYILPLFQPQTSSLFVGCSASNSHEIQRQFIDHQFPMEIVTVDHILSKATFE